MVEQAKHETVANNLANSETTGFKPDFTTFMAIPAESVWKGLGRRESDLILEKTGGGVWMDRTTSDFSPGPLRETRNPLDVALVDQPGRVSFFKVRTGEGEDQQVRYTRNGNFLCNNEGMLVTNGGLPVLSEGDQPIIIPANSGKVEVSQNGDVSIVENGQSVLIGRIGVASTTL
jgi:flagellar hook-basal body protein